MSAKKPTAEKLIDASVPASTPAHIRDWLKEMIVAGKRCSSDEPRPSAAAASRKRISRKADRHQEAGAA